MEYTLLKKITIHRPILFLCGPYYDKSNKSDRRLILQNRLNEKYKKKYIPLVIDDFLTEKNIDDDEISIQIMEEICAAVSCKTYIFLDTMSAAAELGIFANSAYINHIEVFVPKITDIYNKKNVGYFVKEVVMKKDPDRVSCLEYRPGIVRKAIATDYVTEHYTFVKDTLPGNIEESISNDPILKGTDSHDIHVQKGKAMPGTPYRVRYQCSGDELEINVSVKLLFYVTVSILLDRYKNILKNKKSDDFFKFDIDWITDSVRKCFRNFVEEEKKEDLSEYQIVLRTALQNDDRALIYHIVKFVHVYYIYSPYNGYYLVKNPLGDIITKMKTGIRPREILSMDSVRKDLIRDICKDKEKYFEHIVIRKNKKTREIVKYREDEVGEAARKLHRDFMKAIETRYQFSDASYAYRKEKSIRNCVEVHLNSNSFLKYDIRKFFNSIKLDKLLKCFCRTFSLDERFAGEMRKILETCFYEGQLPLGLTASPILSDVYLHELDDRLQKMCEENHLVYTRYADDILISGRDIISESISQEVDHFIKNEMKKLGLALNDAKFLRVDFDRLGSHIRYVGVNIVKGENKNYLSVGRTYIYDVAKEYLNYKDRVQRLENGKSILDTEKFKILEDSVFYQRMTIIGKIGFIRQIEGERGYRRIKSRLKIRNTGDGIEGL